jgi:hypothetical protein
MLLFLGTRVRRVVGDMVDPSVFGLQAPAGPGSFSAVPATRSEGLFINAILLALIDASK